MLWPNPIKGFLTLVECLGKVESELSRMAKLELVLTWYC